MRKKINIQLLALIIFAITATVVMVVGVFYDLFRHEMIGDLKAYTHVLAESNVFEQIENHPSITEDEIRITLIDQLGNVYYDSSVDEKGMENHANRGEYQADEWAGIARTSWRLSVRGAGRCREAQLASIRQMSVQGSGGSHIEYQADEQAGVTQVSLHTGERPYGCGECRKAYVTRSGLYQHRKVHTGERPYECGLCGKTFTTRSYRNRHQRFHTEERAHECPECGRSFKHGSTLLQHRKVHAAGRPQGAGRQAGSPEPRLAHAQVLSPEGRLGRGAVCKRNPPPTPTGAGALPSGPAAVGPLPVPVTGAVPPLRADSSRGVQSGCSGKPFSPP